MSTYMFKQGSDEWLNFRQKYVTATEISSLLGVNSYQTANKLLERKKSGKVDKVDDHYMRDGRAGEALVFRLLEEKGWDLEPLAPKGHVLVFTDLLDCVSSTPDNFVWTGGVPAVIEAKTTTAENFKNHWNGETPPLRYIAQVHAQLHTSHTKEGFLVCATLEPNIPLSIYRITNKNTPEIMNLVYKMLEMYQACWEDGSSLRVPKAVRERAVQLLSESAEFVEVGRHPNTPEHKSISLEELFT